MKLIAIMKKDELRRDSAEDATYAKAYVKGSATEVMELHTVSVH